MEYYIGRRGTYGIVFGLALVLAECAPGTSLEGDIPTIESSTGSATICTYGVEEGGVVGAPTLGIVVDLSGQVIDFEAGSAAQQAGVSFGDTLMAIDDIFVAPALTEATKGNVIDGSHDAIDALRDRISSGKALELRMLRNGQETRLTVTPAPGTGQLGQPTPTAVPPSQLYM